MLITTSCGIPGCHAGAAPQAGLDLTAGNLGNLASMMSTDYPGMNIIDPGNPMSSALYLKLQPGATDGIMPSPLGFPTAQSAADIACLQMWITDYVPSPTSGEGGAGGGGAADEAGSTELEAGTAGGSSSSGAGVGPGGSSSGGIGVGGSGSGGAGAGSGSGSGGNGGGGNGGGADAGASVTFTEVYTMILQANCLPCHSTGGGNTTGKLNMSTQALAYTDLTNATATLETGCNGKLVVSGNHAMSLLWEKLQAAPPCGKQMPENKTPLTAAQMAQIAAWIDDGATNN